MTPRRKRPHRTPTDDQFLYITILMSVITVWVFIGALLLLVWSWQ